MSNEPKETGRLEGDAARRQARIILLEKRSQQLEAALRRVYGIGIDIESFWAQGLLAPEWMMAAFKDALDEAEAALSSEVPEKEGEDG